MTREQLAQEAYNAYCDSRDWKSVKGETLPPFAMQTAELQEAWCCAADRIAAILTAPAVEEDTQTQSLFGD